MLNLLIKITLWTVFTINIILFFMLILGKFYVFKQDKMVKLIALYATCVAGAFLFNTLFSFLYMIFGLFNGNFITTFILPFLAICPFIIGKFTTFDKIEFYTNIQILQILLTIIITTILITF